MKFRCPQCETGYQLPTEVLPRPGDGGMAHKMRCVRCKCVFRMSVELVSSAEMERFRGEGVYFEYVSPNLLPGTSVQHETGTTQRLKFELRPVVEKLPDEVIVTEARAWDAGRTLDLSDYEIGSFERAAKWKARTAGFLGLSALGVFLYIAGMNGWSISVNNFEQNFKKAFFLQTEEEVEMELLKQMVVTLGKGYTVHIGKGRTIGVISGEIQNNSDSDVERVLLEGRILDSAGSVINTVTAPCGLAVPDSKLRRIKKKQLKSIYLRNGALINCALKSGYSSKFKVIFDELPDNFNSTYVFEVHPRGASPVE